RAEIEREIDGRTICDHLRATAENSGGAPALSDQASGDGGGTGWQTLTWGEVRQQVLELAAGFAALGLAKGERVALMLPNRRERLAADPGDVDARVAAVRPEDPVTLLYTSGTTGNPKGVLLTHRNVLYEVAAAVSTGAVAPGVRWVSYLPLAHIAERMFSIYLAVATAGHVHFCPQPTELIRVVGAVKPTSFFGVPRVWEKVRAGIQALLTAEQDESRRQAVAQAMDVGRRYIESRQFGHSTPAGLAQEFAQADEAVLGPI